MKLAIDLNGVATPLTGIGHYTLQLTRGLAHHRAVTELAPVQQGRCVSLAGLEVLRTSPPPSTGNTLRSRLTPLLRHSRTARTLRDAWQAHGVARCAKAEAADVLWEPGFLVPQFSGPMVATVYDLSFLTHPTFHPAARSRMFQRWLTRTLSRADHVVTISRFTRDELCRLTDYPPERISIVSPAAASDFAPLTRTQRNAVLARLGLPSHFLLSLGTLEPRKNLGRLVRAYAALPQALRQAWPLVCVGAKGWNDASLIREMQPLVARGELLRLGYVAQQDLPQIIASANLLAYPSLYEGFGMPVIEAMACGVPVLTSRHTAMHEITGENAFLVEPTEVESIRAALQTALEDPDTRARLGARGIERALSYDWQRSTEALVAALRDASSER